MTVGEAIRQAAAALGVVSDTPRLDAELLMAHLLGLSRSQMLLHAMREESPDGMEPLVLRRLEHEPVAYIVGHQEFFGREFTVSPAVLIPRADSETLVRAALAAKPDARRILDCGTGSGALLLTLLAEMPGATGIGVDVSSAALEIADSNSRLLGSPRARWVRADWRAPAWAGQLGRFDLVVANPPYVEEDADLAPDVRDHEPHLALFAGSEGLDAYRTLIPQLPGLLDERGVAVFEIGPTQADAVTTLAAEAGLSAVLHHDLVGRPRALEFKKALGKAG